MTLRTALAANMLAAALIFAACGDDDDDGAEQGDRPQQFSIAADEQGIRAPESVDAGLAR